MAVQPIPEGYHTVTPYLVADGADKLIDFMKQAFDAQERFRMDGPGGKVGHAEMQVGDSVVMLGDASMTEEGKPVTGMIHLYVEDVDKTYQKALEAGAKSVRELQDMFYGDRSGGVQDPFGNFWWIATHIEDVPPEEMARRSQEFMSQHG